MFTNMGPVDTQHDAQLQFSTYPLALEDLLILARCPVDSGSIFAELDIETRTIKSCLETVETKK